MLKTYLFSCSAVYLLSTSVCSVFMVLYIYIVIFFGSILFLPFSELRLVGLALDLVDWPFPCSAMMLLVELWPMKSSPKWPKCVEWDVKPYYILALYLTTNTYYLSSLLLPRGLPSRIAGRDGFNMLIGLCLVRFLFKFSARFHVVAGYRQFIPSDVWQDVCPSVRPSVCHTPVLSLNGCTYPESFFTIG